MILLSKEIIVNCGARETRVAVLEDGELVEVYLEKVEEQRLVGHIYKGKVANILPGMQAAFVNVGLARNAFLYVDDALESVPGIDDLPSGVGKSSRIRDVLKPGQAVMVQVSKEHFGRKGARITRHITLPGRYLVLMPTVEYIGLSRRIGRGPERERLRELSAELCPPGMGLIVRTMAEGVSKEELARDIDFLTILWNRIRKQAEEAKAPALIHKDLALLYRVVRDLFDADVTKMIIDNENDYRAVTSLLADVNPVLRERVYLFQQNRPIFDVFGIEARLDRMLGRRVWLQCGGYIVIDHTEALTAIDVNTGKFVGSTTLADTVLKANLEAAREIARQLRLRNIGGIIVIDFIDMDEAGHRQQVMAALEDALRPDKTKTSVMGITELGLVEMTRQKVRQGIGEYLQKECPCCEGSGRILTEEAAAARVENELLTLLRASPEEAFLVAVNPAVGALLIGPNGSNLERIQADTGKAVFFRGESSRALKEHAVLLAGDAAQVSRAALPVARGDVYTLLVEARHNTREADGIARVEGYVVQIADAAGWVGERVAVEITKVHKTFATARILPRES